MGDDNQGKWSLGRKLLYVLHWAIILNLAFQVAYAAFMVFVVVKPEGGSSGPLWSQATKIPFELMATRRLYAIEFWIAFGALAIYLALTEIGPRMKRHRGF